MNQRIYLDHNANTPVAPSVAKAIAAYLNDSVGNPSSVHYFGRQSKKYLIQARDTISKFLGVRTDEIVFTSGGTEGANLVIRGLFDGNCTGHLITSKAEHSCVYQTAKILEGYGLEVTYLDPGPHGAPSSQDVQNAIRPNTRLIALMSVNNETGIKTDIDSIAQVAHHHRIPFFVDAVAQFGRDHVSIPEGVSAMSFSGQKIHAPTGIGFCFIRKSFKFPAHMTGGGHQFGRRAGTENLTGIVGISEAVRLLDQGLPDAIEKMSMLRDSFEKKLMESLPNIYINGEGERVANTSNLYFEGVDGETLLQRLDLAGVAASHGSACSSGALEPSRVLIAMGYPMSRVNSSMRFSFSRMTTEQEVNAAIDIIINLVKELRSLNPILAR